MKNEPGEILIPFDIYKEETGKNNTAYSSTKISTAPPTSLKQTPVYFVKGVFIADFPFVTEGEKKDQFLTDWPFFCSVGAHSMNKLSIHPHHWLLLGIFKSHLNLLRKRNGRRYVFIRRTACRTPEAAVHLILKRPL
ncbi:MAG: hypothetical protein IJI08_08310 [Clostridia bacterium]|nr:hypothetical protein [Clostridia bacterium]